MFPIQVAICGWPLCSNPYACIPKFTVMPPAKLAKLTYQYIITYNYLQELGFAWLHTLNPNIIKLVRYIPLDSHEIPLKLPVDC